MPGGDDGTSDGRGNFEPDAVAEAFGSTLRGYGPEPFGIGGLQEDGVWRGAFVHVSPQGERLYLFVEVGPGARIVLWGSTAEDALADEPAAVLDDPQAAAARAAELLGAVPVPSVGGTDRADGSTRGDSAREESEALELLETASGDPRGIVHATGPDAIAAVVRRLGGAARGLRPLEVFTDRGRDETHATIRLRDEPRTTVGLRWRRGVGYLRGHDFQGPGIPEMSLDEAVCWLDAALRADGLGGGSRGSDP